MMTTILSSVIVTVLIGALYLAIVKSDEKMKVIIDTDGGVDDAAAIMLLLSREYDPINVLAITTTNGITDVVNATKNVLITLETVGKKKIPVHIGVDSPLMVKSGTLDTDTFFYGRDGFGDVDMKRPSIENLPKKPAPLSIIDAVRDNPGEVTLICLGPLSNIAIASKMYDNLFKDLKEMYVVGGSIEGNGNVGIPPTWKEFNFAHDAEAAEIVFINSADVSNKIYMLPWEAAQHTNISLNWRKKELGSVNRATIKLLNIIDRKVQVGEDEYWIDADSMLASIFRFKDKYNLIMESFKTDVSVTTCPKQLSGSTVLNARKTSNIIAIRKLNAEIYKDKLLKYL